MKRPSFVPILAFLPLLVTHVWAAPTLTVSLLNGGSTLRVSRSSKGGCRYRLMAATSSQNLQNRKFVMVRKSIQREALVSEIPQFDRPGGKPFNVFFVLREICRSVKAESEPQMVTFPTVDNPKPLSLRKSLKKVGNRMKRAQPQVKLTRVLKDTTFSRPVDLTNAGDKRIFVVEQEGLIYVFDRAERRKVFLDLTSKTGVTDREQGLFSVTFHPRYSNNRRFYVHYTDSSTGESVVEEYRTSAKDRNKANPSSARELLRVSQPYSNLNGGAMKFGPDGYLYISLGDGGLGGDPHGNGQNRTALLGKILRIDVNKAENGMMYGIPDDNPFVKSKTFRKEIFAYGARNIWKFSFDAAMGTLWAADVGQVTREEVNIVTSGANLGWKIAEGNACFEPSEGCDRSGLTEPILDYGRSDGISVTGGYVYRGSKIPELNGFYVFGDFMGGDFMGGVLWAFPALNSSPNKKVINNKRLLVVGFGEDVERELYVISFGTSESQPAIYRLDPQ